MSTKDSWCSKELGDDRLNRRLLKVANDLLNHPTEPIHTACNSWAEASVAEWDVKIGLDQDL